MSAPPLRARVGSVLASRASQNRLRTLTPAANGVDFSSNDYLSLARDSHLHASYVSALSRSYGPASSRLLDGNTTAHLQLESQLATFFRAPSALLFNSGFDANVSIFTTLPDKNDWVVYDADIHASVHDGLRASRTQATRRKSFRHNDVNSFRDTLQSLKKELQPSESVFIALESLYSMSGQFSPLRRLLDIADAIIPKEQTYFILDEAHSTGLVGHEGRGWANELGVEDRIAVRLATFGKAISAQGSVVLCDDLIRQYLVNYARPLIYSTTLPYYALTAISTSIEHLRHSSTEAARQHLHSLARLLRSELGLEKSPSPIVPYITPHAKVMALHLQAKGYCVRPIVWPTVEKGSERLRICMHAGNTKKEVQGLVDEIRSWEAKNTKRESKL